MLACQRKVNRSSSARAPAAAAAARGNLMTGRGGGTSPFRSEKFGLTLNPLRKRTSERGLILLILVVALVSRRA
jgi:hypothetical protein